MGRRTMLGAVLVGALAVACGASGSPPVPSPSTPSAPPSERPSSTSAASPTADVSPAMTTHRLTLDPVGTATLPVITVSAPPSWGDDGWAIFLPDAAGDPVAAVTFWDVVQVYGHPCDWAGTLFDPGPGVEDLAEALAERPLRNATEPADVTFDGHAGKYLEWSVPADIDFDTCDTAGGSPAFESWTAQGWNTDRYQQGPGQVDRLWILDVDGTRLVIDAFAMPDATADQRAQLDEVIASIRFERSR